MGYGGFWLNQFNRVLARAERCKDSTEVQRLRIQRTLAKVWPRGDSVAGERANFSKEDWVPLSSLWVLGRRGTQAGAEWQSFEPAAAGRGGATNLTTPA